LAMSEKNSHIRQKINLLIPHSSYLIRKILSVNWKDEMTNEEIRSKAGYMDLTTMHQNWNWIGYLFRKSSNDIIRLQGGLLKVIQTRDH